MKSFVLPLSLSLYDQLTWQLLKLQVTLPFWKCSDSSLSPHLLSTAYIYSPVAWQPQHGMTHTYFLYCCSFAFQSSSSHQLRYQLQLRLSPFAFLWKLYVLSLFLQQLKLIWTLSFIKVLISIFTFLPNTRIREFCSNPPSTRMALPSTAIILSGS